MIIRDALEADLPAIVEIYNEAIRGRISTAQLDEVSVEERLPWFRQNSATSHPLWVAEIDEQIAGWFSFHPFIKRAAYRGTAEISVYVSERFRRRGVAQTLLEMAIAYSPDLKLSALVGYIFEHNEPSLRLFERMGFERWGLLPRCPCRWRPAGRGDHGPACCRGGHLKRKRCHPEPRQNGEGPHTRSQLTQNIRNNVATPIFVYCVSELA